VVAGHDLSRYWEIMRWPIGELLAAHEAHVISEATAAYQSQVLQWTILAASGRAKENKPPKLPAILKGL